MVIPGHSEVVDLKFFAGDENQSILKGLEFGKHGLMPAGPGFFYLCFIENVASRGKLTGKSYGGASQKSGQKDAQ